MMKQLTPRTDSARTECYCGFDQGGTCDAASRKYEWGDWVPYELSEQLETELNKTKAALEREQQDCAALRQMVRELRDATEAVMPYIEGDRIAPWRSVRSAIAKANQLLP